MRSRNMKMSCNLFKGNSLIHVFRQIYAYLLCKVNLRCRINAVDFVFARIKHTEKQQKLKYLYFEITPFYLLRHRIKLGKNMFDRRIGSGDKAAFFSAKFFGNRLRLDIYIVK